MARFGDNLKWACDNCSQVFNADDGIHPYIWYLLDLNNLRQAGYPFNKNDLSLETWSDLGMVQQEIEAAKWNSKPQQE